VGADFAPPGQVMVDSAPLGDVKSVAVGLPTCALKKDGTVLCWGSNEFGILGGNSSDTTNHPKPTAVANGLAAGTVAIALRHNTALAVGPAGGVFAWGVNVFGMLGNGTLQGNANCSPACNATPALISNLGVTGIAKERRSPEYLAKYVVEEIARWESPIKSGGLQVD